MTAIIYVLEPIPIRVLFIPCSGCQLVAKILCLGQSFCSPNDQIWKVAQNFRMWIYPLRTKMRDQGLWEAYCHHTQSFSFFFWPLQKVGHIENIKHPVLSAYHISIVTIAITFSRNFTQGRKIILSTFFFRFSHFPFFLPFFPFSFFFFLPHILSFLLPSPSTLFFIFLFSPLFSSSFL